ncbi:MAG TPA: CoA transferase [Tepidiformaceae bacterium]|nr:CoA transferase [Tepidiformaceae bacterium]
MGDDAGYLFSGLKVLDVGTWIAAPVAATMLADLGADVIKVEQPVQGDAYRRLAESPIGPRPAVNAYWIGDARNKRSITLNLQTPEAREVLMRLVRECDVYITNQPTPTREAFGLTYEALAKLNPRMIYASLTAYGEEGPDAGREGFDGVAWWARSGLMDQVRAWGATPGMSVPGMGDHPTAVTMYAMIVTALLWRERTGKGTRVHTSLMANGAWANGCYVQAALAGGTFQRREDSPPEPISPNRVLFETADGRLLQLYMIRGHDELDALLVAGERHDLLGDVRFAEPAGRAAYMAEFIEELRNMFRARTADDWLARFRAGGVNVTLVAQMEDIALDEQLKANGSLVPPTDASVPMPLILNHPMRIDGLPAVGPKHAPGLGEHTVQILRELGLNAAEIADYEARGIV